MLDPRAAVRLREVTVPEIVRAVDDPDALRAILPILAQLQAGVRWAARALHDEGGYSWRQIGRAADEGMGRRVDPSGGNAIREYGKVEKPTWMIRGEERSARRLAAIELADPTLATLVRDGVRTLTQAESELLRRDRMRALALADVELHDLVLAGSVSLANATKRLRDRAQRAAAAKARNEARLAALRPADRGLYALVKAGGMTLDEAEQTLRTRARMAELELADPALFGQVEAGTLTLKQGLDRVRGRARREAARGSR